MNATKKRQIRGKKGLLPILIRYRAQDYETRYLDDPRVLYIEEYHDLHRDDGFVAMIPSDKMNKYSRRMRWALLAIGVTLLCLMLAAAFVLGRMSNRLDESSRRVETLKIPASMADDREALEAFYNHRAETYRENKRGELRDTLDERIRQYEHSHTKGGD